MNFFIRIQAAHIFAFLGSDAHRAENNLCNSDLHLINNNFLPYNQLCFFWWTRSYLAKTSHMFWMVEMYCYCCPTMAKCMQVEWTCKWRLGFFDQRAEPHPYQCILCWILSFLHVYGAFVWQMLFTFVGYTLCLPRLNSNEWITESKNRGFVITTYYIRVKSMCYLEKLVSLSNLSMCLSWCTIDLLIYFGFQNK